MENQEELKEDKRVSRNRVLAVVFVILFAIIAYSSLVYVIVQDKKDLKEKENSLSVEQSLNSTCSLKRDSLIKENKALSIYKSLTQAMVHRDESVKDLKYKVGDIVCMKQDSSFVVIEDIVIGGSKYQYYIKYKVLHKDGYSEDVIPELIH